MKRTNISNSNPETAFTYTHEQAKMRYNMGSYSLDKIAVKADAIVKVGKRKFYIIKKIDEFLMTANN